MSLFQTYLEKVQGNKPATVSDLREFLKSNNLLKKNSQEEIFADYARTLTTLMDKGIFNTDDESKKYLNDLISSNDSKYKMEIKNNRIYFSIKAKEAKPIVEKPVSSKPQKPVKSNTSSSETTQSTETTPKNDVLISSDGTKYKIMPANEQGYFTATSKKSNESNYSPFPGKDKDKNRLMESIKKEVKQESRNKNKIVSIGKE
jgi:hypothetical protein